MPLFKESPSQTVTLWLNCVIDLHRKRVTFCIGEQMRCGHRDARALQRGHMQVIATPMPAQAAAGHASNFPHAKSSMRPAMQPFHSRPGKCHVHIAAQLHATAPNSKQQAMRNFQRSRPQSRAVRPADRQAFRQPDASAGGWRSKQQEGQPPPQGPSVLQSVTGAAAAVGIAAFLAATPLAVSPAWGADAAKVSFPA